jgi:hypothetical protein
LSHGVERLVQRFNVSRPEPPAEVAGSGGIRDSIGAQRVKVSFVLAPQLQVFQAAPAAQRVVNQVQHMVRFMIREMDLEQRKALVDFFRQLQSLDQLVHQADASASRADAALRQIEVQVRAAHHGAAQIVGVIVAVQPLLNAALARDDSFCNTGAHSKPAVHLWRLCS